MPAGRMRVARDREAARDLAVLLRHEDGRVLGAADRAQVAALVADASPVAVRDQPAFGLGSDRLGQRHERARVAGPRLTDVQAHTTTPAPPRRGSPAASSSPSSRTSTADDAAEEHVARAPAHDVVAARLERRDLGLVGSGLDVQRLALEMDARRRDRILHPEPVVDHVHHGLHDRAAQARRAGAAEDEMRLAVAQDDRRRHHAREPLSRLRGGRERLEVALAEHVVQVDPGAGDDEARARAGRRRQRRGVALVVDDAHVRRGGKAGRLGRRLAPLARPHRGGDDRPVVEQPLGQPAAPGARR